MPTDDHIDLFRKPADVVDTAPSLAGGARPRGLTKYGWVRTTGWLQFGHHPVSSSLVAAAVSLLCALVWAAALVTTRPVEAGVLVIATPMLCGVLWWLFTVLVRPASAARNIATKRCDELAPGDLVRLYGSIGPIGQVAAVTSGKDLRVAFHGGAQRVWAREHVLHVAELLS